MEKKYLTNYQSIKDAKKIITELNKRLLDIAKDIAKENNFAEVNTTLARRGDIVFLKTNEVRWDDGCLYRWKISI